ncbi:MAG: catalase [Rhizobium sp.]|nr:MAG: catalase [Rhizobium sp.]
MNHDVQDLPGAPTLEKASPSLIVEALKAVAGNPPAVRASFAKGHCVRGRYEPAAEAASITHSKSLTRPAQVLGRFSVGGGNPHVADTNGLVLRGFSVRLSNEAISNFLFENAPVHFARTLDQMLAFLRARVPAADGKPDAERVKAFSEANPETLNQARFVAARPLPESFASTTYWGVHSFPATSAAGKTRFIKFKIVPVGNNGISSGGDIAALDADFLRQDLEKRIEAGNVLFDVVAILDRPGDEHLDVTKRWNDEDERPGVVLGRIIIDAFEPNETCNASIFDPAGLADGIGHPPDEIFAARSPAYRISLSKRS